MRRPEWLDGMSKEESSRRQHQVMRAKLDRNLWVLIRHWHLLWVRWEAMENWEQRSDVMIHFYRELYEFPVKSVLQGSKVISRETSRYCSNLMRSDGGLDRDGAREVVRSGWILASPTSFSSPFQTALTLLVIWVWRWVGDCQLLSPHSCLQCSLWTSLQSGQMMNEI